MVIGHWSVVIEANANALAEERSDDSQQHVVGGNMEG
jgi:hypothetical protein